MSSTTDSNRVAPSPTTPSRSGNSSKVVEEVRVPTLPKVEVSPSESPTLLEEEKPLVTSPEPVQSNPSTKENHSGTGLVA